MFTGYCLRVLVLNKLNGTLRIYPLDSLPFLCLSQNFFKYNRLLGIKVQLVHEDRPKQIRIIMVNWL